MKLKNDGNPIEYSLTEGKNGQGTLNILLHFDEEALALRKAERNKLPDSKE